MNLFHWVASLLTAALSLIGFVQANPTLPPAQKDAAVQTVQQAVTTANNALTQNQSSGTKTYANAQYGFSIQYPDGWQIIGPNDYAPPSESGKKIIYIEAYKWDGALQAFLDSQDEKSFKSMPLVSINWTKKITIDNSDDTIEGIERGEFANNAGFSAWSTYFYWDENVFTVFISERDKEYTKEDIAAYERIVTSFAFDCHTMGCLPGVQQGPTGGAISVPDMSEYTDSDFGFSFWYPSGWTVNKVSSTNPLLNGTVVKSLVLSDEQHQGRFDIDEITSADRSITTNQQGKAGVGGCDAVYSFDPNSHEWMFGQAGCQGTAVGPATVAITTFNNTMGGLHMFGGEAINTQSIVPLSAHNFVVITRHGDPGDTEQSIHTYWGLPIDVLVHTVIATDPAVATPVSKDEQIKTIQAEKDAYAGQ